MVGGVAGGLVGVGASIAVLTTGLNASATAGGTLNAGDDINITGALDEDISVASLAGAAGFVGLGAAVVVINDHSTVAAGIANNAVINNADAIAISRAPVRNIKENLFGAFIYNVLGIPVAAGVLYPFTGLLLNPIIAGAAMAMSSVTVVSNANRLRWFKSGRESS